MKGKLKAKSTVENLGAVDKKSIGVTSYRENISVFPEFDRFNNNCQQVDKCQIGDGSIIVLNLSFYFNKNIENPLMTFTLPEEIRPIGNVVLIAYVARKPGFAYLRGYDGQIVFEYAGTISTTMECNIIGIYTV